MSLSSLFDPVMAIWSPPLMFTLSIYFPGCRGMGVLIGHMDGHDRFPWLLTLPAYLLDLSSAKTLHP